MSIQNLKEKMPEYAKDIKLNLSKVVDEDGIEGLSLKQGYMIALASAYSTQNHEVINAVDAQVSSILSNDEKAAAKASAAIMAMNNIYYRFVHLVSDKDFATLPANLRMNIIGNPGVDKVDFELMSLAVSSINGCGMCIDAHVNEVARAGVTKQGIQSCIRIAAVLSAVAQVVTIEGAQEKAEKSAKAAA